MVEPTRTLMKIIFCNSNDEIFSLEEILEFMNLGKEVERLDIKDEYLELMR